MHNHYHVILHIDKEAAQNWNDIEVIERWHQLFAGNDMSRRIVRGESITAVEEDNLNRYINEWRARLMDISWFMRILNESIARLANKEDDCTGRLSWTPSLASSATRQPSLC